jgi:hypothetical protein
MPNDHLGTFEIPENILAKIRDIPEAVAAKVAAEKPVPTMSGDWMLVRTFKASKPRPDGIFPFHTVEARWHNDSVEYRCSCQGFKIGKKGFCRHTKEVAEIPHG